MFSGYLRKISLPLVPLVAVGWLLLIIGFGIETNDNGLSATGAGRYSQWMVILVTPFMLAAAVAQAAIDKNSLVMNIIGAITTFLSALFLTALGYILNIYGIAIYVLNRTLGASGSVSAFISLQFSGALIAGIFWVLLTCIAHFYKREGDQSSDKNGA